MSGGIGGPINVRLPPQGKHVIISSETTGQQMFHFDTNKQLYQIVKEFCEKFNIVDCMKYSFKTRGTDKYITEETKHTIGDGHFLVLCESSLTIANRIAFELEKEDVKHDHFVELLRMLKADEEFARTIVSLDVVERLHCLIWKKGITMSSSAALQCLVLLFSTVSDQCKQFPKTELTSSICNELVASQTSKEPNAYATDFVASSFQLLSAFLEAGNAAICESMPEDISFAAVGYLESTRPPKIIGSAMMFLNSYLKVNENKLAELLNNSGGQRSGVELRKALANVLSVVASNEEVAKHSKPLLTKIMEKETEDWQNFGIYSNIFEAMTRERLEMLKKAVAVHIGHSNIATVGRLLAFDAIVPVVPRPAKLVDVVTLSLLQDVVSKCPGLVTALKDYNLNHCDSRQCQVPLGLLASEVCNHALNSLFADTTSLSVNSFRVVFCEPGPNGVNESSYNSLLTKFLDLAVSTWKLMEGGKTPRDRVLFVVREQMDLVTKRMLRSPSQEALDARLEDFCYTRLRQRKLKDQAQRMGLLRTGHVGRRLVEALEPLAFGLVRSQRLAALARGESFDKFPKSQHAAWPCRYLRLSAHGSELAYQDSEVRLRNAPSQLQYSIGRSDVHEVLDGSQLARPVDGHTRDCVLGFVDGLGERMFFQAADARTCLVWKDGLKLFSNPDVTKEQLSAEFRQEVDTVVQLEVLARLSEVPSLDSAALPKDFFRKAEDIASFY